MDRKWWLGIAASVIAALIIYYVENNGPGSGANAQVVEFTQIGAASGQRPSADIGVENDGKKTAEDCLVHWDPGMVSPSGGNEQVSNSYEFSLDPGQQQTFTFNSPVAYGGPGTYPATVQVVCSNTTSPTKEADVQVS